MKKSNLKILVKEAIAEIKEEAGGDLNVGITI